MKLTSFRREDLVVIKHVLDPSHDIIDVSRCCKVYLFVIRVDPSVVQSRK
jgi:hypothetical protein